MLEILNLVVYVIAVASVVSCLTPVKEGNLKMAKAKKYIDMIALNVGQVRKRIHSE